MTADQWNAMYDVGMEVNYYPVIGRREHINTRTRSEAWTLGDGTAVVKVDGRTGGVNIYNVIIVDRAGHL